MEDCALHSAKRAFKKSMRKLGLEYLDLYLIHQPYEDVFGAWRAMEELNREGRIRAIGVSNFHPDRVMDIIVHTKVVPTVNQIEVHPFLQQVETHRFLAANKVQIQSWGPFAEGKNDIFKNPLRVSLATLMKRGLKVMPVVVVTGARQTGKSTLVRDLFQDRDRGYFTLDRLEILEQAKTNPDSLLEDLPVTLDEVQREPSILLAIKRKVDEARQPGMILLTGSANLNLMNSVSESLAGRALYLELPPFCPVEWDSGSPTALAPLEALFKADFQIKSWPTLEGDWHSWLLKGGYPSAIALENNEDRDLWFSGYVQEKEPGSIGCFVWGAGSKELGG